MGRYDKDRHQKELVIRYCIARGLVPCLEVVVPSVSDLSDSVESLTDLDVLGLEFNTDGGLRRTIFDCKTGRMSAINRAFWAAGVLKYSSCNEAFIILRNKAVDNHRLSALQLGVDIHDEQSFIDLGRTFDTAFEKDNTYQYSIERWNKVYELYQRYSWSENLFNIGRNVAPNTPHPWGCFRRIIADLRQVRGQLDPSKDSHLAIYLDVLAALFILWSVLGRDIRRFYQPSMTKGEFEKILRYYLWGGKETYALRQELSPKNEDGQPRPLELPAWDKLVGFAGIVIGAPQELFGCTSICRNLSIRAATGPNSVHDSNLTLALASNKRARQFILAINDYMVAACSLPRDIGARVVSMISELS